jgi:peptide/nickel transport system permease protein
LTAFILRRILNSIPTLFGCSLLIFFITQAAPGDFLSARLVDPNIRPEAIEALRRNFGLDQPIYRQYLTWLGNIVQGDFGLSFTYRAPVLDVITPRIINSLYLVLLSTIFLYLVAVPFGVYGAVNQYSTGDKITSVISYFFLGIPSFFFALLAIFVILQINFATGWGIPVAGMTSSDHDSLSALGKFGDIFLHILIPSLILVLGDIAGLSRFMRGQMLEYLSQDFTRTARSKGLKEHIVVYKHTLRNAIIPFVATIGGLLPALFTGAGFVEVVFSYPGITPMFLTAISQQDIFIISGFSMMTAVLLVLGNLLGDILLAVVDPRISYG